MNTLLWVLQTALALFFIMPALAKLRTSRAQLVEQHKIGPGDSVVPIRVIGTLEVLGIIGIILPLLLGIAPVLTPLAAVGFALVMIGATIVHYKKGEYKVIPLLVVVFLVSAYVAWSRFQMLPA